MQNLTFYTNPRSRGRIVRWMLEELEITYNGENMEYDSLKTPEYLAINPMGKIPALRHGDTVITEVAAICAYLADHFSERGLAPEPASAERGSYYRWLFFAAGPLEMAVTTKAFGWEIDAEKAIAAGCGLYQTAIDTLEQAVSNARPWLCGEQFTAADVLVASYLGFYMMMNMLEPTPTFEEYVKRAEARPAAIRANAKDDALIEVA